MHCCPVPVSWLRPPGGGVCRFSGAAAGYFPNHLKNGMFLTVPKRRDFANAAKTPPQPATTTDGCGGCERLCRQTSR